MSTREIIGKLTKQESVIPIEKNKISNTFAVHIPSPLASYYTRFSQINKPNSVLLITSSPVSFENILRATSKINKENNLKLEGAKSEISFAKGKYSGIRLKGIEQFSDIESIQKLYQKEGFELAKDAKIKQDTNMMIRINKFFHIINEEEGIYHSPNNNDRYYITIPKHINWDEFIDLTKDIKNNVSVTGFDVAKGIFYDNEGITEMIRIVKPDLTLEMVREIKEKFLDRLS